MQLGGGFPVGCPILLPAFHVPMEAWQQMAGTENELYERKPEQYQDVKGQRVTVRRGLEMGPGADGEEY